MFAIRSADWQPRLERRLQSCQPLRPACIKEGRRASNCSGYRLDDFIFLFGGKRRAAKSSSTRAATHPDPSISQFCVDAEFKRTIDTRAVLAQGPVPASEIDGDGRPLRRRWPATSRRRPAHLGSTADGRKRATRHLERRNPNRRERRSEARWDRIDLNTVLAVERSTVLLQETFRAKRATIRVIIGREINAVGSRAGRVRPDVATAKGLGPANQPLGATTMSGADKATARLAGGRRPSPPA